MSPYRDPRGASIGAVSGPYHGPHKAPIKSLREWSLPSRGSPWALRPVPLMDSCKVPCTGPLRGPCGTQRGPQGATKGPLRVALGRCDEARPIQLSKRHADIYIYTCIYIYICFSYIYSC